MPERFYQQENKGSFVKKLVGWVIVGAVGLVLAVAAIDIGAAGFGIPTTPNAPLLKAA